MPVSLFGMLPITTHRQRFTYVGPIPQPWLPTVLRLTVATSPHGSVTRRSSGGHVVPDASHPGVTPDARPGRVPVAEHRIFLFPDQYTCDLVSHVRGRRRRERVAAVARGDSPEASGGNMQSASNTPSSHSRRGWRSPRRREAATAWRSRPRSGAHRGQKISRHGASPCGGRSPRTESRATRDSPVTPCRSQGAE
jgi:hypothetical protein